jgi:acyl carrier protein
MTQPPSAKALVAEALDCDPASLADDSGLGTHPKWDSMGHLTVMLALEAHYGIAITDETIRRFSQLAAIEALCDGRVS